MLSYEATFEIVVDHSSKAFQHCFLHGHDTRIPLVAEGLSGTLKVDYVKVRRGSLELFEIAKQS